MNTWTPLWSGIVDSSLWMEDDTTVKVFVTMLALKDSDHVCRHNAFSLARKCNKTEAEVVKALNVLAAPDTKRIEKQPFEGRRIMKVEDGWLILNGEFYRKMVAREMEQARWRRASTTYRQKKKKEPRPSQSYLNRERRYCDAMESGDTKAAEAILEEGLPVSPSSAPTVERGQTRTAHTSDRQGKSADSTPPRSSQTESRLPDERQSSQE